MNTTTTIDNPELEKNNNIDTAEAENTPAIINDVNEELPDVHLGRDFDDYMNHLEEEFGPRAEELGDNGLNKIKHDLNQIRAIEANPTLRQSFDPAQASVSLLRVFQNMKAWEQQMISLSQVDSGKQTDKKDRFYGSKKTFMTSCNTLYPGLIYSTSLNLAGTEVLRMERELASVNIGNVSTKIAEIKDLTGLAMEIDQTRENDPETAVRDLEALSTKISQGIDNELKRDDLTGEDKRQLNLCVEVLYKIQILIKRIKDSDVYKQQKKNRQESEEPAQNETAVESHESLKNIEGRWNSLFKEELGSMENYLEGEIRKNFGVLKFDTQKGLRLNEAFAIIYEDYQRQRQENPLADNMTDFKFRLGQAMNGIL